MAASVPLAAQYVSVIAWLELDVGIRRLQRRDAVRAQVLRTWFDGVRALFAERTLPVDEEVVQRCAPLHVPDPAPPHDALIAATALQYGLTLVTRNVRDFAGMGVDLIDPWGPGVLNR